MVGMVLVIVYVVHVGVVLVAAAVLIGGFGFAFVVAVHREATRNSTRCEALFDSQIVEIRHLKRKVPERARCAPRRAAITKLRFLPDRSAPRARASCV